MKPALYGGTPTRKELLPYAKQYIDDNMNLSVITLDPSLEEQLRESVQQSEFGSYLALDPDIAQLIIENISLLKSNLSNQGITPIILCAPILRIYFKRLLDRFFTDLVVISYNEIDSDINVEVIGMVTI